ncbi:MAG: S-layer homology domain-containing protein [Clostridiales Family XIII bacterium]|jgi:hypothetical protein|nr:S-layer homology domain-containing protein [Clostridiales Family XIII bacterium]
MKNKALTRKCLFLLSAVILALALPAAARAADTDIAGHWAEDTLAQWSERGWLAGDGNGHYRPNDRISRAEFMALVNRMKGYAGQSADVEGFADVSARAWYYETVSAALHAGYINGLSASEMAPERPIARQEAIAMIARISNADDGDTAVLSAASDGEAVAAWAAGAVAASIEGGIVAGSDGRINPTADITRAEATVLLDRVYSNARSFGFAGEYGPESGKAEFSEVTVASRSVLLRNMSVAGDLTVTAAVSDGDVYLNGITVKGGMRVLGGGMNSIHLSNCEINTLLVEKNAVRITVESGSSISTVRVTGSDGIVALSGGKVETLTVEGAQATISLASGAEITTLNATAENLKVETESGTSIATANIHAQTAISGQGTIGVANINADNVVIEQTPVTVNVAEGVTASVGGKEAAGATPAVPSGGGGGGNTDDEQTDTGGYAVLLRTEKTAQGTIVATLFNKLGKEFSYELSDGFIDIDGGPGWDDTDAVNSTLPQLVAYTMNDGKLASVSRAAVAQPDGPNAHNGYVNMAGTILTNDKGHNYLISTAVVVFEKADDAYRMGEIGDLMGCGLSKTFWYHFDSSAGLIAALVVDAEDALHTAVLSAAASGVSNAVTVHEWSKAPYERTLAEHFDSALPTLVRYRLSGGKLRVQATATQASAGFQVGGDTVYGHVAGGTLQLAGTSGIPLSTDIDLFVRYADGTISSANMAFQSNAFSAFSPFEYYAENGNVTALLMSHGDVENFAVVTSAASDAVRVYEACGRLATYAPQDGDPSVAQNALIKYVVRDGKLKTTATANLANTPGADGIYGSIDASGKSLTVSGESSLGIDANAVLFVYDSDGTRRVGNLDEIRDCYLMRPFRYYAENGSVQALAVDLSGAYESIFILINSVASGSDGAGGQIDVVQGLSFADGVNAATKTWSYPGALSGKGPGPYPMPVKFKVNADGILRAAVDLDDDSLYTDSQIAGNPTIRNVGFAGYYAGSDGAFVLATTTGGISGSTTALSGGIPDFVAFEANTVLYKKEGGKWVAMHPTEDNFKADEGKAVYSFLKTDPYGGAYDIIIKTDQSRI